MLAEFFDRIVNLGRASAAAQVVRVDGLPDVVYLRDGDKPLRELAVPPARRDHVLSSFQDLVEACRDEMAVNPEVWVSEQFVRVSLDRDERRDLLRVPLDPSDRWTALLNLRPGMKFTPQGARHFIRFELGEDGIGDVMRSLAALSFKSTSSGEAVAMHGKSTLGRAVEREVLQAADVPEEFSVEVPIWRTRGFNAEGRVRIGVELDMEQEKVLLRALPGEVDAAVDRAVAATAAELRGALGPDVPVFCGQP